MRITRQHMFMSIAQVVSQRSTCFRRNVGAIIVRDNNIISIGYNGPPSGELHCTGQQCVPNGQMGCTRALHAEANALNRCPTQLRRTDLRIMFTTESPCPDCAQLIIDDGIDMLYYLHLYRVTAGVDKVARHIPVFRMTPSGMLINHKSGELVYEKGASPGT